MTKTTTRSAGVILGGLMLAMTGCGFLQPGPGSAEKTGAGLKADANPFTGDRRGDDETTETAETPPPRNEGAARERESRGEATAADLNRRMATNRSQSQRQHEEGDTWFGMTTDGGFFIFHYEAGTENDIGVIEYELDDSGEPVLDDRNQAVVRNERPEVILFRGLSSIYPFDPTELVVYDPQAGRVRRVAFTRVELPGAERDEAGFLGNNICHALIVPDWLSARIHSRAEGDEENAPARSHLLQFQLYSRTAAEHFGDEQQGWLPLFPEFFGPDSECFGVSTNPALEWRLRRKRDNTHVLSLVAADPMSENIKLVIQRDVQH